VKTALYYTFYQSFTGKLQDIFLCIVVCFRRVEEFKEYGDMDMMMQYVKEVQTVQKKLTDSVEAIGFINEVCMCVCLFISL